MTAMRFPLFVVATLLASACSTTEWNEMRANPREYFNLTSPTLQTDARVDGTEVRLKRGQALVVRLDEDPASGQRWEMAPPPRGAVIAPVQRDFVAKRDGSAAPEAPGDALFRLRGVTIGSQTIEIGYRGPGDPVPSKRVRFDVIVVP